MSTLKVTVEVSKELYELGQGVAAFVASLRDAVEDGWQVGEDLPVAMAAALSTLVPALDGITEIDDEIAANRAASARAVSLALVDTLFG